MELATITCSVCQAGKLPFEVSASSAPNVWACVINYVYLENVIWQNGKMEVKGASVKVNKADLLYS